MKYEDALREWGARKLQQTHPDDHIYKTTVSVQMDFDEGYACCGGANEGCYCSLAESPSANVRISGDVRRDGVIVRRSATISHYDFNFAEILGEIVAAAGGRVTL